MSDGTKLAPSLNMPAPSPAIAEPAARPTVPQKKEKPRPIPPKMKAAIEACLSGQAKNQNQAAKIAGCSSAYLSQTLSERPDILTYLQNRARRLLGLSLAVAAPRLAALLHSESDHVALKTALAILGIGGIAPVASPTVSINVEARAGWIIDLSESDQPMRIVGGAVTSGDATTIDATTDDTNPADD